MRELLPLDVYGRYTIGTAHDGSDAKVHMQSAARTLHGFLVGVTGSGKTVTVALMCAAWALAGLAVASAMGQSGAARATSGGGASPRHGPVREHKQRTGCDETRLPRSG
ncbi:DUF853 family protein [Streptomyces sp. SID1328]|uniref:DUF853 family protein n=1 Tax=Streptomyces sp. SID1328 TaxID=2690250 RepID=UPI00136AD98D|nr:DUF853 family protein [Streptomyces sp. SID1328]MYV38678.1 DUF853 family protein [Streptomyces sp. SID1328]